MADISVSGGGSINIGNASDSVIVYGNGKVLAGDGNSYINVRGDGTIKIGSGSDTLDLWGSGKITQTGSLGTDTIYLGHGSDTIKEAGTAVFHTSTGCATVIGGTFEFSNLPGSSYATYHALSGQETLLGVNGPTEFIGGDAKSSVLMEGGLSNDTFVGGAGSDTMVGGGGSTHNLFEFLKADAGGTHLITNFVSGQDHLYLEGYSLKYLENHGDISTSTASNNVTTTTITLGDGTTVKLQGVNGLSSSDITTHKPGH